MIFKNKNKTKKPETSDWCHSIYKERSVLD